MSNLSFGQRLARLYGKLRSGGVKQAWASVRAAISPKPPIPFPLAGADPDLILAPSMDSIRDFVRHRQKQPKEVVKAKDPLPLFPLEFTNSRGTKMRYAFYPARAQSQGLVVLFHGYLGFEIDAANSSWQDFDLLLPLDNFGWNGLGSWFWGEAGDNFVETATQELIEKLCRERGNTRWFCTGASMGGFAALYHGIKHQADGIYVMTPILNLKPKIERYRQRGTETAYTAVADPKDHSLRGVPDIYIEAKKVESLPPLFLTQNQYDRSTPFGVNTIPLLQIYDQKKGWAGLRIQPAIGHQGHDGSYAEAQYFFGLIAKKSPPRVVDFLDER